MRLTYKAFGTFILKSYRETINGSCNGFRFLNNQRQSIYSAKHSNDLPKRFKISFIMSCLTDKTEISKCMNYHFLLNVLNVNSNLSVTLNYEPSYVTQSSSPLEIPLCSRKQEQKTTCFTFQIQDLVNSLFHLHKLINVIAAMSLNLFI